MLTAQDFARKASASQAGYAPQHLQPARSCSKQIANAIKSNRVHPTPFMFHYRVFAVLWRVFPELIIHRVLTECCILPLNVGPVHKLVTDD